MFDLIVVSARIEELQRAVENAAIPDIRCRFFSSPDALDDDALQAEIALGAPDVLAPVLGRMPKLKWVQSTWAGITPFLAVERRGYQLTGVRDIFGASMSEYVLAWMLAFERRVLEHAAAKRWEWIAERGLSGLRLGIAGTGSIGREVARRCAPFVREVVGLNSDGRELEHFSRCYATKQRHAFATGLDVLVMILPNTRDTHLLVDASVLECLAPDALLLNTGRANSLDHDALVAALRGGQLRAAVLDVLPEEPLVDSHPYWEIDQLYITSHTSAPTVMDAIVGVFRENLERYRSGQTLHGLIDFERGY